MHPDVLTNRVFDPSNLVLSPPPPPIDHRSSPYYNSNNLNQGKPIQQQTPLSIMNFNHHSSINEQIYLNENGKRKSPEYNNNNINNNNNSQLKNTMIMNELNLVPPPLKRSALSPLKLHSNTPNSSPSPNLSTNNNNNILPLNLLAPSNLSIISPISSPHSNSGMFSVNNQIKLDDATFLKELKEKEKNLNNCKLIDQI